MRKGADSELQGRPSQRRQLPNCQSRAVCSINATPTLRPEAVVCVAGPLTTSLRGLWVSGLLPPDSGGLFPKGGDPRTGYPTKGTDSELLGWRPKEKAAQLPQKKRYSRNSVGGISALEGRGTQKSRCVKGKGPKDPCSSRRHWMLVVAATATTIRVDGSHASARSSSSSHSQTSGPWS